MPGKRIGPLVLPNGAAAGGVWTPDEHAAYKGAGRWPEDFPKSISGLTLWFAAHRLTGLNDGDAVATWPDLSGNGYDVTQGTAANKPLYKTNIFKGLPALLFDGSDDYFENTTVNPFVADSARTLFFVVKLTAGITQHAFMCCRLGTSGLWFGYWVFSPSTIFCANMSDNSHNIFSPSADGGIFARPTIICVRTHQTVAANAARVDGAAATSTLGTVPSGETGTTGFRIGARESTVKFMNGYLAEVIGYNSSLSDANCLLIEKYLAAKYLDIAA